MKKIFSVFSLTIIFAASTAYAVWSDPISSPTGDNTEPPINVSADAQIKTGGFSLGSLISESFIKLGVASTTCDAAISGTVRFNNGVLEVCTNEPLGSPITSIDPGIPVSCADDQLAFYNTNTADWECGDVPEELTPCSDGEGVVYDSGNWSCALIQNKFIDGTNTADAVYTSGSVGIPDSDPKGTLHIGTNADASLVSENHALNVGDVSSLNIAFDNNEIQSRDNGSIGELHLQNDGGRLSINNGGAGQTDVHFVEDGSFQIGGNYVASNRGKLVINNSTNTGPDNWNTSIKFTNGSHNAIWNPAGGLYFGLHSDGNFYYGDESGGAHEGYPMVIDSDNGNTTITGLLYVGNADDTSDILRISSGRNIFMGSGDMRIYGDGGSALYFDSNDSTNVQLIYRDSADVVEGRVYGSGNGENFGLLDKDGNWMIESNKDDFVRFRVDNTIMMTVENTGDVGIGATPSHRIHVVNNTSSYMSRFRQGKTNTPSDMLYLQINRASPDTGQGFLRFEDSGGNAHGYITGNNSSGVNFTAISDRRLKKDIVGLDPNESSRKIVAANPARFAWKESGHEDIGYIAQDLEKVVPLAVVGKEGDKEIIDVDGVMTELDVFMTIESDMMIPIMHSSLVGEISKLDLLDSEFLEKKEKRKDLEKKFEAQQKQIDTLLTKINN